MNRTENDNDEEKSDTKEVDFSFVAVASEDVASKDVASEVTSVASQIKDKKPCHVKKHRRVIFNDFPRFQTKQKKIPPPHGGADCAQLNQFHSDLDRQTATQLFRILENYHPEIETKRKKKKRLKKKREEGRLGSVVGPVIQATVRSEFGGG
jgi:hypothetical protein